MRTISDSRLANLGANTIVRGFDRFQGRFQTITQRARTRFEQRDWHGHQGDAAERLDIYGEVVARVKEEILGLLNERLEDKFIWSGIKAVFSGLISERNDWELAETFFNSVTRRIFTTVGVDPLVEFVSSDFVKPPTKSPGTVYQQYTRAGSTAALVEAILTDFRFRVLYGDLKRDARLVAADIDAHLAQSGNGRAFERAEIVRSVFYRGKGAYIVGRLLSESVVIPIVLALRNDDDGVAADAVLLDEDDVSILFSFTRSYFKVEVDRPFDLVQFLHSIMPRKRRDELYTAVGYHKHGKTELYRDLLEHLATTTEHFETAPGARGLVMVVFTMPGYEVVFKVLRDVFGTPKQTTRQRVMDRYRLVFRHDRAGRLIDAQEFEFLQFERRHFDDELLDDLIRQCGRTVHIENGAVIIDHCYIERRVDPLNLYVRQQAAEPARRAVIDYGRAIKDLAATNIFPGDMLLKNFGVTRHRRVVFYDYDEVAELTECSFKHMPVANSFDDEFSAEPWFGVGDNDMFPEEFRSFLGLPPPLRAVFEDHHSDLFDPAYWTGVQDRLRAGEVIEIFPYGKERSFRHD